MQTFNASSGAEVIVNLAPWANSKRLKNVIEREILESGVVLENVTDLTSLIPAILKIDSSDAFDAALAPCLARCTYKGEKINDNTFENIEARGDYYEIITACIKENIGPLADSLISMLIAFGILKIRQEQKPGSPSGESATKSPSSPAA